VLHPRCVLAASRSFENTRSNPTLACLASSSAVMTGMAYAGYRGVNITSVGGVGIVVG
jgi:hypothetical protein